MKLPRPMVVLFGAGATRAATAAARPPAPLDLDFFEIALQLSGRGTRRLANKVADEVFSLYGRTAGIGLEQYYRDIETRMELSSFAKSQNRPKDWLSRKSDLEELVRRVLIHTTCEMNDGASKVKPSEVHSRLLRRLQPGDSLVTFNYDTVIEESMPPDFALWTPRDGYGTATAGITHVWAKNWLIAHANAPQRSKVQLLKLHGSLNWVLYKTSQVRLKPRPYIVRARKGSPVSDKAAILPPGWHKRVNVNPYRTLWGAARRKLERCATLVIIGYSLPDTDLIARALFLEMSRLRSERGNLLKELHLADVSEAARNRLTDVFVPALGSGGVVFRYGGAQELADRWSQGREKTLAEKHANA